MIHIQGVFTKAGEGKLLLSDGTAAASNNHDIFRKEVGEIVSATKEFQYTHDEFETMLRENTPYLFDAQKLVEQACEENDTQKVIGWLDDAEDECKKFLIRKGYLVYDSEEEAIEELAEDVHAEIGGPNVLHGTYASDTMDDISTFVKKHGWLRLHNIIEAAL